MHYSRLILNARHNQAKSELACPYELHRTLCQYFENPEEARILFRADTDIPGEIHVIVQSLAPPDWSRQEEDPKYLLEREGPKEVELSGLKAGQVLRFRLRCRPSRRVAAEGSPDQGKRKSLKTKDEIFEWLHRKAQESGFRVEDVAFDRVYWYETKGGLDEKPLGAVQFEGVLVVEEPDKLREAVGNGIGPQKAYGFGLLSLAPLS